MRGMGRQPPASGGERALGAPFGLGAANPFPLAVFIPPLFFLITGAPLYALPLGAELEGLE